MQPDQPAITPSGLPPKPPFSTRQFAAGAITGLAAVGAIWLFPNRDYGRILPLLFDAFVVPVIAVILALVPRTRAFGLGLLLVCGLSWLVLWGMCAGVFR